MKKRYLGDSVYADNDGFHIALTTENGNGPSNEIFLEDSVFRQLLDYASDFFNVDITMKRRKNGNDTSTNNGNSNG